MTETKNRDSEAPKKIRDHRDEFSLIPRDLLEQVGFDNHLANLMGMLNLTPQESYYLILEGMLDKRHHQLSLDEKSLTKDLVYKRIISEQSKYANEISRSFPQDGRFRFIALQMALSEMKSLDNALWDIVNYLEILRPHGEGLVKEKLKQMRDLRGKTEER